MNTLLISGFGNHISVDRRKLIVVNRLENKKLVFYPHQIPYDSIVVDGYTGNITFEAIRWLMKHNVSVTILNWNGNLLGTILPKEPISSKLKVKQYEKYLNDKTRYYIANSIIDKKISTGYELLIELSKYYNQIKSEDIDKGFRFEKSTFFKVDKPNEIRKRLMVLRAYEGRVADFYWKTIYNVFNSVAPEFNFNRRNNAIHKHNMNASDEINALLNYGYAVLESEIRKDLNDVGLDSTIGFVHEVANSKMPLVYDLQELYRWLIDKSVIELLEDKKLKKSDFIVTENYHIRLTETTAKLLIDKINANFNSRIRYNGKMNTYQTILLDQIRKLAKYITEQSSNLLFDKFEITLNREDTHRFRDQILSITPEKRKKLGINKSTLWYQKKNIQEGKRIKVYQKVRAKMN